MASRSAAMAALRARSLMCLCAVGSNVVRSAAHSATVASKCSGNTAASRKPAVTASAGERMVPVTVARAGRQHRCREGQAPLGQGGPQLEHLADLVGVLADDLEVEACREAPRAA